MKPKLTLLVVALEKKKNFRFSIRCRGPKRRSGMRGNIVQAWRYGFTKAKEASRKTKR